MGGRSLTVGMKAWPVEGGPSVLARGAGVRGAKGMVGTIG